LATLSLAKISAACQAKIAASTNRPFEFHKRRQHFIRVHNEPLSVVPMRIHNPDCSPFSIRN
jgi:hypothetical protein